MLVDERAAALLGKQCQGGREVAAGTVAGNGYCFAAEGNTQGLRYGGQLAEQGVALFEGHGVAGFGRPGIFGKDDDAAGAGSELADQRFVGVKAAEHPAAAVYVKDKILCGGGGLCRAIIFCRAFCQGAQGNVLCGNYVDWDAAKTAGIGVQPAQAGGIHKNRGSLRLRQDGAAGFWRKGKDHRRTCGARG